MAALRHRRLSRVSWRAWARAAGGDGWGDDRQAPVTGGICIGEGVGVIGSETVGTAVSSGADKGIERGSGYRVGGFAVGNGGAPLMK